MSGHEFEKKVQRTMDEFKLHPSDAVWANVRQDIRNKHRRQTALLWIPALLLLLAGGGYFFFTSTSNKNTTPAIVRSSSETTPISDNSTGVPAETVNNRGEKIDPSSRANTATRDDNPSKELTTGKAGSSKTSTVTSVSKSGIKRGVKIGQDRQVKSGLLVDKEKAASSIEKDVDHLPVNRINVAAAKNINESDILLQASIPVIDKSDYDFGIEPELAVTNLANGLAGFLTNRTRQETKFADENNMVKVKPRGSKWQWGVTGSGGISRVIEGGIFNVFESPAVAYDRLYSGGLASNPNQNFINYTSSIKTGINWTAGAFIQRQLSNRIALAAGLRYSHSTTRIVVGSRVDSAKAIANSANSDLMVANYYKPGQENKYTNAYHFIELPVTMRLKINPLARTTFNWNVGFVVGHLLKTNALHFDNSSGVYYKDSELFNRTQLGLTTGFSVDIFNAGGHPLEIGPSIQYNVSNLFTSDNLSRQHLLAAGIDARWFLKK